MESNISSRDGRASTVWAGTACGEALRVPLTGPLQRCKSGKLTVTSTSLALLKFTRRRLTACRWSAGERQKARPQRPAALAVEDGVTYLVEQSGKDIRMMLIIHRGHEDAPTYAHRAVFMAEKGYLEQAKMLLALLKKG